VRARWERRGFVVLAGVHMSQWVVGAEASTEPGTTLWCICFHRSYSTQVQNSSNNLARAYGMSDNVAGSPPVLSSSYYNEEPSSMITPAPQRQQVLGGGRRGCWRCGAGVIIEEGSSL
jgi:hypothetical protein